MDSDVGENGEKSYKSCFARSVVVNSKYQDSRASKSFEVTTAVENLQQNQDFHYEDVLHRSSGFHHDEYQVRNGNNVRKNSMDSTGSSSNGVSDFSVENLLLKSQVETLQWQLKQTEENRQMYQAVMKQVVSFLEKAHRSLEHLGTRLIINNQHNHQGKNNNVDVDGVPPELSTNKDYDYSWRRRKKEECSNEEIRPEKLSQEAYRLLRTAESLLNTREPDLANLGSPERRCRHQRPPLASSTPHLPCSEESLTRKAVLRRQHALKCNSFHESTLTHKSSSFDFESVNKKTHNGKVPEKSVTPPMSSVSSAEDESGFSSMNSFQELGIPIIVSPYEQGGNASNSTNNNNNIDAVLQDRKLWQTPTKIQNKHKRWSSTPVENGKVQQQQQVDQPLKVLWV